MHGAILKCIWLRLQKYYELFGDVKLKAIEVIEMKKIIKL